MRDERATKADNRVLVMGPDAASRRLTAHLLEAIGACPVDGGAAWSGLDRALETSFRAIVCDEGADAGYGETLALAAAMRGIQVPLVVISSIIAEDGPSHGPLRLRKPVPPEALRAAI